MEKKEVKATTKKTSVKASEKKEPSKKAKTIKEEKEPVKKETVKKETKKEVVKKESKKPEEKKEIKKVEKEEVKEKEETKEAKKEVEIREVIVEKRSGFNFAEVIIIIVISLIFGTIIGSFLYKTIKDNNTKEKVTVVTKENMPEGFEEFLETYENIINNYYEEVNSKELIEAGINGMLEYLGDDYSVYMDKNVSESFNEQVEGKYNGIGVEIASLKDVGVQVLRVFSKSPAEEAGIKPGDIFIAIDGVDINEKTINDVVDMIRNSNKKKVNIVAKRGEEEVKFEVRLSEVNIDSVESEIFEKNGKKIGYIGLSLFAANTYPQFNEKLAELEKENIDGLIIDVRGNSGGYLTTVTDIASLFLEKGKVIYQLDTKGKVEKVTCKKNNNRKYKVVVLMDKNSASASEILAAAMKESYGATLIGTNTFGKGTVQDAYQLKSGSTVKYTIQKWLTPNGNWINKTGVEPDIKVELDEEYAKNPSEETDKQFQAALEELSK